MKILGKILLAVWLMISFCVTADAQRVIRGRVVDKDGRPVPGARISVKGGEGTALSEFDGSFRIVAESQGEKLLVDYVGYNSRKVSVDKAESIVLKPTTFWNDMMVMGCLGVYPQVSYGLMIGYVQKFGGYVKFRSDFNFVTPSYDCTSDGKMDNGVFWATGQQQESRIQMTGGMLFRLSNSIYPYVGVGCGSRGVYWEDFGNVWAQVSDYSCRGVAAEAGMIFRMGPMALSVGVSTTSFNYTEAEVGLGVMF